jgi:HSP20 family protein
MMEKLLPTLWQRNETPLRRAEESPLFALHREMNRMFDEFFRGFDLSPVESGSGLRTFYPSVDVREDDKKVIVKAELPGIEEADVDLSLADNGLTIKGEKRTEKEEKGKGTWYRETSYGAFHRFIPLPDGLDREKVEARFKNGVLTVTFPRLEETKTKKIAIKAE